MDAVALLTPPLAAVVAACWIIGAALGSRKQPGFRPPFLLSLAIAVVLIEP